MNFIELDAAYALWSSDLVAFAATLTGHDDAADAVADVFQALLADPTRWHTIENPRGYLFRSVANAARARARSAERRRQREHAAERGTDRGFALTHDATAEGASGVLVDRRVRQAIAALSPQQRAAVFLTYWLDEPVDQVAQILGVRPGTVRRQLARARHRIRGALT